MLVSAARRLIAALLLVPILAASTALADVKDPNEIIRSLAPIEYLPEHGGQARGPSIDLSIPFALNSAKLKPGAETQLRALGEALRSTALKEKIVEIGGHTDAIGDADYNLRLSKQRAETVREYLVKSFGLSKNKLRVVGFGEARLKNKLIPDASENRRVEITVVNALVPKVLEIKPAQKLPPPAPHPSLKRNPGVKPVQKSKPIAKEENADGIRIFDQQDDLKKDGSVKW